MNSRIILLDRDGVLNVDLPNSVCSVDDLRLEPGVALATAILRRAGVQLYVITNQACIGRGDTSMEEVLRIHGEIEAQLAMEGGGVDGWFICPHTTSQNCECRKPKPGLLLAAATKHHFDLNAAWFVGDAERDVLAARAAGAQPALVRSGKGITTASIYPEVPQFDDLQAFVAFYLDIHTP